MEAPATAIAAGTVIAGTYRIERALGEGGMGLVFEARHLRVARRVAIKVLRTAPGAEELARFRQEAEIASRIGHPNIIEVFDFNTMASGMAYLVMELLEGESLSARARRGPMPHTEALPILRQIASGLFAAHGAGVIHRDLKPANVFLVPRELDGVITDHVKILDFGISKVQGSLAVRTQDDVVLGTPRYMAPEQALGLRDEIDARADQFALAVIAFELLAGRAPFEGDNGTKVMFNIVYQEPSPLAPLAPAAPPEVVAAIERALSKRPQDRFADMSELAHALTGKPFANAPERPRDPSLEAATLAPPRRARSNGAPAPGSDGPPTANDSPRARAREDDPPTPGDSPRSIEAAPRADDPPTANDSPRARAPAPPPLGSAPRADGPPTANESPRARAAADDPPTSNDSPRARAAVASRESAAPHESRRGRRRRALIAGAFVAGATTIIFVVMVARRTGPAGTSDHAMPPPEVVAHAGNPIAPSDAGLATVDAMAVSAPDAGLAHTGSATALFDAGTAIDATASPPTDAAATSVARTQPTSKAVSPEALALLDEAERLLRAGQLLEARFAAQRALRIAQHPRAHLVLAEAACRANDLGAAHAAMRALSKSGRTTARSRCAAVGFPVDDP